MGEFEDQSDSSYAICPYCDHKYEVEGEDYSEDERVDKCDNCGKKYFLNQSFSVTHETKPDCEINDQEHDFVLKEFKDGHRAYFCSICGKCKLYKESEK